MKTITILSVAIATSLATHLVLAHPLGQATNTTTSAQSTPVLGRGGHHAGKQLPQKDAVAKTQTQTTTQPTQVTKPQTNTDPTLAKIDTNQDGKITPDELKAAFADQIIAHFDVNHDGKITQDEVQALRTDEFKKMDTSGDGFLSIEEFQNGMRQYRHNPQGLPPVAPPVGTTDNTQIPPPGPKGKHGHHFSDEDQWPGPHKGAKGGHLQAHFNRFDTNGDGQISEAELVVNLPVFDKFDCNETGVITKEDLLKGPCQKAQPTTTPATTTTPVTTPTTEPAVTTTPVTTTTTAPAVTTTPTTTTPATTPSTTVEETTTETTVAQPTTQSDHSGGAPCSTCHK